MKSKMIMMFAALAMVLPGLMAADAGAQEIRYVKETVTILEKQVEIVKTADNFIILFDTSSSMGQPYKDTGKTEVEVAKEILKERNANFPDLAYNAGLYTFTPKTGVFIKTLKPYYDMKPYNKAAFADAIEQLPTKASGPTMLEHTLDELDVVLSKLSGRTVVFLFSDGTYSHVWNKKRPAVLARELSKKYDVCFHVINTAEDDEEQALLKSVASINECSRVIRFSDLLENPEYFTGALFVIEERIVEVLKTRMRPVAVQPKAQAKVVAYKMDNILFDFDSSEIQPAFYDELDALGGFMQRNTQAYVILSGFTDSTGPEEYNLGLSRKRAESAGKYLSDKFNIDPGRIVLQWYGEAAPVGSNDTREGRKLNRRVVAIVSGN
ncbi:OmpA family protein [Thermodesulfobacteriota bacterium]